MTMLSNVAAEALRLLEDHRKVFHGGKKDGDCRLCRSLRRALIEGLR